MAHARRRGGPGGARSGRSAIRARRDTRLLQRARPLSHARRDASRARGHRGVGHRRGGAREVGSHGRTQRPLPVRELFRRAGVGCLGRPAALVLPGHQRGRGVRPDVGGTAVRARRRPGGHGAPRPHEHLPLAVARRHVPLPSPVPRFSAREGRGGGRGPRGALQARGRALPRPARLHARLAVLVRERRFLRHGHLPAAVPVRERARLGCRLRGLPAHARYRVASRRRVPRVPAFARAGRVVLLSHQPAHGVRAPPGRAVPSPAAHRGVGFAVHGVRASGLQRGPPHHHHREGAEILAVRAAVQLV